MTGSTSGKWTLALKGTLAQFNLSLLLIFGALIAALYFCVSSTLLPIQYGGTATILILLAACVRVVLRQLDRQEPRPANGQQTSIEVKNREGARLVVRNPPDTFFAQEQTNGIVRAMLLGYDDKLCPDGRVIGPVAEERYQEYTEEEKKAFIQAHRREISGRRSQAERLLSDNDTK